jgi:hypothetical protein
MSNQQKILNGLTQLTKQMVTTETQTDVQTDFKKEENQPKFGTSRNLRIRTTSENWNSRRKRCAPNDQSKFAKISKYLNNSISVSSVTKGLVYLFFSRK